MLLLPICLISQNITIIGVGRLGICMALLFENAGYQVLGVDVCPEYIRQMNDKTFVSAEPHVMELLQSSRHFYATTSLEEGLAFADICFIAVPTNDTADGYNFNILSDVLSKINRLEIQNKHIVISSTVTPGYIRNIALPLLKDCTNVTVSYNPEFIAQGDIIRGLRNPDIILIGDDSEQAGNLLESIYKKMCLNEPFVGRMSIESAEIAKLALNCFVTAKIAFANLVGDIADQTPHADKVAILHCIGKDPRIGSKYFKAGYGFGGPCFPRDNSALANYADSIGIDPVIFRATDLANQMHATIQAAQYINLDLDQYVFEDVCYKSDCAVPIITASQKLAVAEKIAKAGKKVIIEDRAEVLELVERQYGDLFKYKINNRSGNE